MAAAPVEMQPALLRHLPPPSVTALPAGGGPGLFAEGLPLGHARLGSRCRRYSLPPPLQLPGSSSSAASGLQALAAFAGVAAGLRATPSAPPRAVRTRRRARGGEGGVVVDNVPTEYYSLLGLPLFTSDRKEIKAAHRRCVKLVHPDILGVEASALQTIVTEAYNTLSDEGSRENYDRMLRKAKPTLAKSRWSEQAEGALRGVFVNEVMCERCYQCVDSAPSTFAIHTDPYREDKSYVAMQWADPMEAVAYAINNCPTKAIKLISREELPSLEYAMTKSVKLRSRARPEDRDEVPGPFEILADDIFDKLIEMDMEEALRDTIDPVAESEVAEELTQTARTIYNAALSVPEDVRSRLWSATAEAKVAQQLSERKKVSAATEDIHRAAAGASPAPGVRRASLKTVIFDQFDKDGDGFLFSEELRAFANNFGFDGTDEEWFDQYNELCVELGCAAMEGLDLRAFSRMVDDEEGCYLTDDELATLVAESSALPRAGR